jgi:uncharacterized protein (TIGR01777 family)
MKIIVTGATGFIGKALVKELLQRGHKVVALTRGLEGARRALGPHVEVLEWHPPQLGPWADSFQTADGVVNLAGEPVANKRWTEEQKARLRASRLDATRAVVDAITRSEPRPTVLVNQSAIGYYGSQGDAVLTEESQPGSDFLARLVVEWEAAAKPVEAAGVRLVILRTGIVLGAGGGALPPMVLPFRMFAGGTMGDPGQWVSWIHLDDEIETIVRALTFDTMRGTYNAVAPNPVTMETLSGQIGRTVSRPSWVPGYGTVMRMALGRERGPAILSSERVLPARLQADGYEFHYTQSHEALKAVLSGNS